MPQSPAPVQPSGPLPTPSSPTIRRVLRDDLCSGCGLCAGVSGGAIRIGVSPDGYNRPFQSAPVSDAAERAIAAACPGAVVAPWPDAPTHLYWGPHLTSGVGHATDPELWHHASSGGMVSALLIRALRSGLVDAVVQIVADPALPTQNRVQVSRTEAQVVAASGSRYAGSSPLEGVGALLETGDRYAFVGKPCDVSALRLLGTVDPRVATSFPIALSFFCGGMPSRRGTDTLLAAMGVAADEVTAFRYRGDGWPGKATATRADGSTAQIGYMESWGHHLSKVVQMRCKICPDAVGGAADIACADAWYGDDRGYPLFEERDGRSAVIARTPAGARLLADAIATGEAAVEPLAIAELDRMQPSQARRKRQSASRLAALRAAGRTPPRARGVALMDAAWRAGVMDTIRGFGGMLRRLPRRG